jgi:hypothetical protein
LFKAVNPTLFNQNKTLMFNSPVLDTAIGLVFIFLLYSLLATSINEAIATLLSLRARMLRKGIIEGMLTNSCNENAYLAWWKATKEFLVHAWRMIRGKDYKYGNNVGDKVYQHPIMQNYGTKQSYPLPSYIPSSSFATIMIDVLRNYASTYANEVAQANQMQATEFEQLLTVRKLFLMLQYLHQLSEADLQSLADKTGFKIDKETVAVLYIHIQQSFMNLETFTNRLEDWFNESMSRASGWYKRQTQRILFVLGLGMAVVFNVDIIQITGQLSTDKDA